MAFTFGASQPTTQAPSGGLFSTSASIFGQPAQQPAQAGGFSFGQPQAATAPQSAFSFGAAAAPAPTTTQSSLFGNLTPATKPSGFSFGAVAPTSAPALTATNAAPTNLFGHATSTQPQTTTGLFSFAPAATTAPATTTTGQSLFGGGSLFGATATTAPASATPQPSLFSAAPTTSGLFSGAPQTTTPSTGLFGAVQPTTQPASTVAPAGSGLFGFGTPQQTTTAPATTAAPPAFSTPFSASKAFSIAATTAPGTSAPNLFGTPQTVTTAAVTTAPTQNLFGSTLATTTAAPSLNLFGTAATTLPVAPTLPQTASLGQAATGGLFGSLGGGLSFGATNVAGSTTQPPTTASDLSGGPKPTQPTITTTNSTAPPSGGFIFGGGIGQPLQTIATQQQPAVPSTTPSLLTTTQTPIQTVTTQSNTISSTPTKPSALAFVAPTAAVSQPAATTAAPKLTLGFGTVTTAISSAPSASSAISLTSTTTASDSSGPAPPQQVTYKQLEDLINRWTADLEDQERLFLHQATQVNAWDRVLVENGQKIAKLYEQLERMSVEESQVDHELDFVLNQQNELSQILDQLEKSMANDDYSIYAGNGYPNHADTQRERIIQLAVSTDTQLKQMAQDLTDIVEKVNAVSENKGDGVDDTLQQISVILGKQMDTLQWVDKNTGVLQQKVRELSQQLVERKRESDRSIKY